MKTTTPGSAIPRLNPRLITLSIGFVLLTGCSTLGMYKADKNDVCYTQRVDLLDSRSYYAKSVVAGVIGGAIAGAATGALFAAIGGGNVGQGAAIGAGTLAVAGGIGAYYQAKQKDIADAQALAVSIQNDILKENGEIDRASIAFVKLRDCRFANAERIKSEYRTGRIKRDEAVKKLNDLKEKFEEDIKIAEEYGTKMSENMKEFQHASGQMLDRDPDARTLLVKAKNPPPTKPSSHYTCGKKTKTSKKSKGCFQKPENAPVQVKKTSVVEMALVAENNQLKQKDFGDTVSKSKDIAKAGKFDLDVKSDGPMGFLMPENMVCEL
jgi:hypothetical protein